MRFTDFYATAPFCSPSRASLLTGRYPVRAGVPYVLFPTELTGLPPDEITIAEILADKGYATAAIGKWHLGWPKPFRAQRHGFDFFYGLPYSNDLLKWEPDTPLWPQHAFWKLPLLDNDDIVEAPVNQHTLTRRYTERAVRFIEENRNRTFFLYIPHTFPHTPHYASEDFEGRSPHSFYTVTVEEIDWSVGEVLRTLRALDLDENTLVIFTSDNGPRAGRHPLGRPVRRGKHGRVAREQGNYVRGRDARTRNLSLDGQDPRGIGDKRAGFDSRPATDPRRTGRNHFSTTLEHSCKRSASDSGSSSCDKPSPRSTRHRCGTCRIRRFSSAIIGCARSRNSTIWTLIAQRLATSHPSIRRWSSA